MSDNSDLVYLSGVSPSDLGLPPKFTQWRHGQDRAVDNSLSSDKRVVIHAAPVGSGKSVEYIAEALFAGVRTAVLTSTKALQKQLLDDFSSIGLKSVCGRQNFTCIDHPQYTCEDGSTCGCKQISTGACPYKIQYQAALTSPLVVTNYAYWAAIHRYGEGLGEFGLLVLDEAHDAAEAVCSVMDVHLTEKEVTGLLRTSWPKAPHYVEGWRKWADEHLTKAQTKVETFKEYAKSQGMSGSELRVLKDWSNLASKLATISSMLGEWAVEPVMGDYKSDRRHEVIGYKIRLVWPRTYAETILYRGVPKIVATSATILPRSLPLLGFGPEDFDFFEYPYIFPLDRSPVYVIPTTRMNSKTSDEDIDILLDRVDEIITDRLDRKGIIHTTSYRLARMVEERSHYAGAMIVHDNKPGQAQDALERFLASSAPSILVTPSMTTGQDFKYTYSEYQIILKAPYGDFRDPVTTRRVERDNNYTHYDMAQTLAQMCGRSMRAEDDRCETFILDSVARKILHWKPGLFPQWLRDLIVEPDHIPSPPPSLMEEFPGRWER